MLITQVTGCMLRAARGLTGSEFEREVRSLLGAITKDSSFGERRSNEWRAASAPTLWLS